MELIRKFILLAVIILISSCRTAKDVWVDEELRPNFDHIVKLFEENDIKFNYGKLKYVRTFDLQGRLNGYYHKKEKIVYIDKYLYREDWYGIRDEIKTAVLAHEMAHSQKIWHNNDITSIMGDSVSLYITYIIKFNGLDKSILEAYGVKD